MQRILLALAFVTLPGIVIAQEAGSVGMVAHTGFSSGVGVLWHLGQSFALRPGVDISFAEALSETPATGGSGASSYETHDLSLGVALDGIYYLEHIAEMTPYVGVGAGYNGFTTVIETRGMNAQGSDTLIRNERTNSTWSVALHGGLQYAFSKRLAAFGEMSVSLDMSGVTATGQRSTNTTTRFYVFSPAVGVVFYVN